MSICISSFWTRSGGLGRTKTSYTVARSRERGSFSPVQEERVFLFGQGERGQRVCPVLFHCPGLGKHFACVNHPLFVPFCYLVLLLLLFFFYLIAASGELFLSQHINFAFCASIVFLQARRNECKH